MGTVPQCAFGQITNKTDSIELSKRDSSILRKLGFRIYREFGFGSDNTGETVGLMWPEGPQCIHYFWASRMVSTMHKTLGYTNCKRVCMGTWRYGCLLF